MKSGCRVVPLHDSPKKKKGGRTSAEEKGERALGKKKKKPTQGVGEGFFYSRHDIISGP